MANVQNPVVIAPPSYGGGFGGGYGGDTNNFGRVSGGYGGGYNPNSGYITDQMYSQMGGADPKVQSTIADMMSQRQLDYWNYILGRTNNNPIVKDQAYGGPAPATSTPDTIVIGTPPKGSNLTASTSPSTSDATLASTSQSSPTKSASGAVQSLPASSSSSIAQALANLYQPPSTTKSTKKPGVGFGPSASV